jgi:hypothetical protein
LDAVGKQDLAGPLPARSVSVHQADLVVGTSQVFGGRRRKIVTTVLEMMRQQHSVLQTFYGVPKGFWEDPFVLGYQSSMVAMLAKAAGSDALGAPDRGQLLFEIIGAISNLNASELLKRVENLTAENDPDFKDGKERGQVTAMALVGALKPNELKSVLINIGFGSDISNEMIEQAPALIQRELFFQEIRKRFEPTT